MEQNSNGCWGKIHKSCFSLIGVLMYEGGGFLRGHKDVRDLKRITANLNKQLKVYVGATRKGMVILGLEIKRESMINTPVDEGNLRYSNYLIWSGVAKGRAGNPEKYSSREPGKAGRLKAAHSSRFQRAKQRVSDTKDIIVEIGNFAYYAIVVHENLYKSGGTNKPFFLYHAVNAVKSKALSILKSAIRKNKKKA